MPMVNGAVCDECGRNELCVWKKSNHKVRDKILRESGWSIGKEALCPVCKERRKIPIPKAPDSEDWYCQACEAWVHPTTEQTCPACGSKELCPF